MTTTRSSNASLADVAFLPVCAFEITQWNWLAWRLPSSLVNTDGAPNRIGQGPNDLAGLAQSVDR